MDVWDTTSRYNCVTTARETTQQETLSPKWDYSGTLETHMAPDLPLTLCWWFCCKICRQTPHGAHHVSSKRFLQDLPQLEGQKVLGARYWLGLHPPQVTLVNDVVCNRRIDKITTQQPPKSATPTIPTHLSKLWSEVPIFGGYISISTPQYSR